MLSQIQTVKHKRPPNLNIRDFRRLVIYKNTVMNRVNILMHVLGVSIVMCLQNRLCHKSLLLMGLFVTLFIHMYFISICCNKRIMFFGNALKWISNDCGLCSIENRYVKLKIFPFYNCIV